MQKFLEACIVESVIYMLTEDAFPMAADKQSSMFRIMKQTAKSLGLDNLRYRLKADEDYVKKLIPLVRTPAVLPSTR